MLKKLFSHYIVGDQRCVMVLSLTEPDTRNQNPPINLSIFRLPSLISVARFIE